MRNCGITKAHANMGPQSVKQRDRIPEAPVEKLLGIKYRRVGESSRPRQSHKLEIAGANPASATKKELLQKANHAVMQNGEHEAIGRKDRIL